MRESLKEEKKERLKNKIVENRVNKGNEKKKKGNVGGKESLESEEGMEETRKAFQLRRKRKRWESETKI